MFTDYDVGYTKVQNAAQLVPLYDNVYDCHKSANTDHYIRGNSIGNIRAKK